MEIQQIANKVEKFTGITVNNIGRKINREQQAAKRLFYRTGFLYSISGTKLAKFVGDKSRFNSYEARLSHINKCKTDNSVKWEWEKFKLLLNEK